MRTRHFHITFVLWHMVLLFPICLSAQELTMELHKPLCSDSLWAYKLPYVQVTDTGRNCVWDFSDISTDTAEVIDIHYYCLSDTDSTLIGLHREHAHYYYDVAQDTLWQTGFETSRTYVHYSLPLPILRFPFVYGDSLSGIFIGEGQYCHMLPLAVEGSYIARTNAVGQLKLPDIQIDSALQVHSVMNYHEKSSTKDAILEEHYSWYSPYCRYPVFETVLVRTLTKTDTISIASAYYIPQEQKDMPKREYELEENPEETLDSLITNVRYVPNPVYTDLQIQYTLIRPAQVYISVHYNGGTTSFQTPLHREEEGEHVVPVNMAGMQVGSYTIYIYADDTVVSGNIIRL